MSRNDSEHLPDYEGTSLVNLMSSLRSALGASGNGHPPLTDLDLPEICANRHVVLLVVDGLGYELVSRTGAMKRHLRQKLTSVFPSTTASAITTFLTGLAPQQHGLTGWFMYFQEIDCVATPLPFVHRASGESLLEAGISPPDLFDHEPIFHKVQARPFSVAPEWIAHTPFNLYHSSRATQRPYGTLAELFDAIAATVHSSPERAFVYAYYPEIDALGHAHGINSEEVAEHVAMFDEAFERFLIASEGSGTTVLVTADHGFVDPPPHKRIALSDHPEVASMLKRPLCGESRAAYCYVDPGDSDAFERYVDENLAHCARLMSRRALLDQHYFGLGEPHRELASRIGDYTLIMREDYMVSDWQPGANRNDPRGVHGGLSAAEMYVPLCMAQA